MASFAMEEAEQLAKEDAASRLTYEIFSILETKFLFGCGGAAAPHPSFFHRAPAAATTQVNNNSSSNKVCVLSIDGGACPADGLLAAAALVRLEAALRRRANNKDARLPDFFDVAAGSGAGGVLAAMLFARGPRGRPMYSAHDALAFLLRRVRRGWWANRGVGLLPLRRRSSAFEKVFGYLTLRDTVRPVLVPCYDLATRAPLLFSRAAAVDSRAHDFRLRDVCAATCAGGAAVEVASVDGATRVAAAGGGGAALGNPTAAAITHVLNNKREFPGAAGVGDLLVLSVGTGEGGAVGARPTEMARIAAEGVSDMVDQAVAMAFGHSRTSNYVRIQGTGSRRAGAGAGRGPRMACGGEPKEQAAWKAEAMLLQKSVESVLFQGRRLAGETNAEKIERFARELVKEHARRKQQLTATPASLNDGVQLVPVPPPVAVKQQQTANPGGGVRIPSSEVIIKPHQPVAVKQQPTTNPSNGVLVPSSAAIVKQHSAPAQNVTVAAATSATVTEPAAAAAQVPVPRRRRRTPVRTVVATTKRAPGTSSSSRGARKRTL